MGFKQLVCGAMLLIVAAASAQTPATAPAPAGPQRWEEQIQSFEAADREQMPDPSGVVFVGSSSIRGWKLQQAFPGTNVINRGFGGSRASDAAHFAERLITPYKPRLVIFYSGENDVAAGAAPQDVLDSFSQFVDKVRQHQPDLKIAFISLKPSPARWHLNDKFQQTNRLIREYIDSQSNMHFIDIQPDMLDESGQPREELFVKDMLHMNEKGYAIWNEKLRPFVEGEK